MNLKKIKIKKNKSWKEVNGRYRWLGKGQESFAFEELDNYRRLKETKQFSPEHMPRPGR